MSLGKGGGTTVSTPQLSPEQRQQIAAQTEFFTGTIAPAYRQATTGAQDIYNRSAAGVNYAAQNQAAIAQQAQRALGGTGESALRTGITGLESLYSPAYEAQQMQAALMPAQAQYQQNIANLQNQFGGAGQIGSARQALANTQLAGTAQMQQMQAAADVQKAIAAQRLAAGQSLISAGQGGLGQAIGAAGTQVQAAMTPQNLYNQYASVLFGVPAQSWNPNFAGTQGMTRTGTEYQAGLNATPLLAAGLAALL